MEPHRHRKTPWAWYSPCDHIFRTPVDPAPAPPAAMAVAGHAHDRRVDAENTACVRVPPRRLVVVLPHSLYRHHRLSLARLPHHEALHHPTVPETVHVVPSVSVANAGTDGHRYFHTLSVAALFTPPGCCCSFLELALPTMAPDSNIAP